MKSKLVEKYFGPLGLPKYKKGHIYGSKMVESATKNSVDS
jgi:hypothetical protein